MTEYSSDWVDRYLSRPTSWTELSDEEFLHLCVGAAIRYGTTLDGGLISVLFPMFIRLCDDYERDSRLEVLHQLTLLLDKRELHAMALLPLVICDVDRQIVSTATLDLLAYSEVHQSSGLPYGLVELLELARLKVPRSLGYVLGGLVAYGDSSLRLSMDTIALHCDNQEIAQAARCWSGFLTHAAIDFWLSICETLQAGSDLGDEAESRLGFAASALVNCVRMTKSPVVVDIVRRIPATAYDSPIEVRKQWSFRQYANLIKPRLQALADAETGEKIMPVVMREWGLKAKSPRKR